MNWFTADQHFNHENILKLFVYRKFRDVEHMNAEIIRRFNERVKHGDTVFHLGDFRVSSNGPNAHELKAALNGNNVYIQGNHDKRNGCNSPIKYVVVELYGRKIVLAHRPEDALEVMDRTALGIDLGFVGHVHEKWKFKTYEQGDLVNVGVDQWDFYPVGPKQIFKAYATWKREGHEDR
jgi:calcineurin-like phosphoesterase family protein